MNAIHILWWRYYDGSGVGLYKAFTDKDEAETELAMVKEVGEGREWAIAVVPLFPQMFYKQTQKGLKEV